VGVTSAGMNTASTTTEATRFMFLEVVGSTLYFLEFPFHRATGSEFSPFSEYSEFFLFSEYSKFYTHTLSPSLVVTVRLPFYSGQLA
jgi:hypothetical protein